MTNRKLIIPLLAYPVATLLLSGCGATDAGSEDTASQSAELSASTNSQSLASLEKADMAEWQKSMTKTPLPHKGCFQSAHPSMEWHEVPCASPANPPGPHPRPGRIQPTASATARLPSGDTTVPFSISGGTDFAASMQGITQVVGTFPFASALTSETDKKTGTANQISLQINTNTFNITNSSTACKGPEGCTNSTDPSNCQCWQQFILDNPGWEPFLTGMLLMQYWLINYGNSCPDSSWTHYGVSDCYRNSNISAVPTFPISRLPLVTLTAQANANGIDYVIFGTGSGQINASAADSAMNLSQGWSSSEFNVFGDGNGSEADFNLGARVDVHQSLTNGTSDRATCVPNGGTTGESNNLSMLGACCPAGGKPAVLDGTGHPGIQFAQTNGIVIGDLPYCLSASLDAGVSWSVLPGTAQDIGVGNETTWIVDSNTYIQKWIDTNNSWQATTRSGAKRIAVQPDGVPWYVDTSGNIFQGSSTNAATISWTQRAGCANDIGIGANGDVWIVGCSAVTGGYGMFKWGGSNWIMDTSGGGGTRIAVDSSGLPWIVNSSNEIFQRTSTSPTSGGWHMYSGGARDIGIGPAGYPWIVGTSTTGGGFHIFGWDDVAGDWKSVTGGGTQISVGRNGRPWLINNAGAIFRAQTQ